MDDKIQQETRGSADGDSPSAGFSYAAEISHQAESVELYRFGTEIFRVFEELTASETSNCPESQHFFITEGQRFKLWAHSLGLHRQGHASLDYRVRDVMVVRSRFADVLGSLRDHLNNLLSIIRGERRPLEEESGEEGSSDTDSHSTGSMSNSSQSSDSFHEIDFRQHSVMEAVDALYSLAAKIRNPRNRPQRTTRDLYKYIPSQLRDDYIQEREAAEIAIVRHVQHEIVVESCRYNAIFANRAFFERFGTTENFLVRRMGIANARRRQQFVYWREHAARIRHGTTTHASLSEVPGQEKTTSGITDPELLGAIAQPTLGVSRPEARPSNLGRSLATSATRLGESFIGIDNIQSIMSYQSRASTAVRPEGGKLDWPPPPPQPTDAKFFTCPYCHVICPKEYLAKEAWR
jgi:hypothetical protein